MEYEGREYETGKPFTVKITERRVGFWASMYGKTLYVREFDPMGKYPALAICYYSIIECEDNKKQFKSVDHYYAHTLVLKEECMKAVSTNTQSLLKLQEEGAL